ncbi:ectoine/hydroxyectoine ABC transporter permease subunit EhuD [Nocardioides marmoriginsengisoli]|uniref:Ectoine/hydroxyectoine ABC transporter permease subunit EhuD n=1 Tax=Nocardioides marmoriginsengisoli TaxID=661483 RepID=A0A3N0CGF4_9ACTN|nr:ectoine/hydroxyectoine ABC transporter permease subunit EhuD [Nocardioides marmoriginsengisoli]RNL62518.1 ectoine/hydroxyectoine ABC transporter permease subunit EhuD [Nocardioides marmoriginsengisoli]
MDLDYLQSVFPELLGGLRVTVVATLLGAAIALVLGLLIACVQVFRVPVVHQVVTVLVLAIRNTPLLAQLFFMYYVLPRYGIRFDAFTIGALALGLHFSCYAAQALKGGFLAVPKGQWEACQVLGLGNLTTLRSVVLPQALPPVIPTLTNLLISMFKDSAVLYAITIMELLGTTRNLASTSFQYTTLFTAMGLMYLVIALPASIGVRRYERRLNDRTVRA